MIVNMKNTKKGLTLVEVLVAISVFTIIIFALFTSIAAMRKVVSRQEEAVRIKMACQDMNVYWEEYKNSSTDWFKEYFGVTDNKGYLTSNCKPTANPDEAYYTVTFDDKQTIKIVSSDDRVLIENLQLPLT